MKLHTIARESRVTIALIKSWAFSSPQRQNNLQAGILHNKKLFLF